MKKPLLALLLGALCTTTKISAAAAEVADRTAEEHDTLDTAQGRKRTTQPSKPPTLQERWNNFSFRTALGLGKKKPISAPTAVTKPGQPVVDVSFDGRTELNRLADLKIDELKTHLHTFRNSTEQLTPEQTQAAQEDHKTLGRVVAASRVIEKALRFMEASAAQNEELQEAIAEFKQARTALVEAVLKKENTVNLQKEFNAKLTAVITKINELQPRETIETLQEQEQTKIDQALADAHFAQIEDTDPATLTAYKNWSTAQRQAQGQMEKLGNSASKTGLTELDAQLTLEQATANLIAAIKTSKRSATANKNWKSSETFSKTLTKMQDEIKALQQKVAQNIDKRMAFQDTEQLAFESLATKVLDLNPEELTLAEKESYLKTGNWFTGNKAPNGSFSSILRTMKTIVSKMKSAKQAAKDKAQQEQDLKLQQEQGQASAAKSLEAKKQAALNFLQLFGKDLGNESDSLLPKLVDSTTFTKLVSDTQSIDAAIEYYHLPDTVKSQLDAFKAVRERTLEALIRFKENPKNQVDMSGYNAQLQSLIEAIMKNRPKRPTFDLDTLLEENSFVQVGDTDAQTQDAYHQIETATRRLRTKSTLEIMDAQIALEKAREAFKVALKQSKHSSTAKKNWKTAQKFKTTLTSMKTKVTDLKKQAQAKLSKGGAFKTITDQNKFSELATKIEKMNSTQLTFEQKIAYLQTAGFLGFVHSDSFEDILKEMQTIIGRMKSPKQVKKESAQAEKTAQTQREQAFKQQLTTMEQSGFFTRNQIAAFRKQGTGFSSQHVMSTFFDHIKPTLQEWSKKNPVTKQAAPEGGFHSIVPARRTFAAQSLPEAIQTFLREPDTRSFRNFLDQLTALQQKAKEGGYTDFPQFTYPNQ